jgi:hypothetical protein
MGCEPLPLAPADLALLERVAARVVELRVEVPAILALESVRPLSVVAGQALVFFQPMVQALLRFDDYRRFAALAERREALEALTGLIERRAEESRAARRASRAARKEARRRTPGAPAAGGGESP